MQCEPFPLWRWIPARARLGHSCRRNALPSLGVDECNFRYAAECPATPCAKASSTGPAVQETVVDAGQPPWTVGGSIRSSVRLKQTEVKRWYVWQSHTWGLVIVQMHQPEQGAFTLVLRDTSK